MRMIINRNNVAYTFYNNILDDFSGIYFQSPILLKRKFLKA